MKILDAIYSTRITLEGLATRYGMKLEDWPQAVLESLKARHNQIYSQIEDQICSLGGAYHPLGECSACTAASGALSADIFSDSTDMHLTESQKRQSFVSSLHRSRVPCVCTHCKNGLESGCSIISSLLYLGPPAAHTACLSQRFIKADLA